MINGFPEKLRSLRSTFGLSQREVANCLNLSSSIISSYETGERTPSVEVLIRLATLYQCSTDYLLGRDTKPPRLTLNVDGLSDKQIQVLHEITKELRQNTKS